ncbi:hypothetical protein HY251_21380 [bacterium]|nr:hypothetical protein [bacterium]
MEASPPRRGPLERGSRRTTDAVGLAASIVALAVTGGWVLPHLGPFPPVVLGVVLTTIGVVTFAYLLATGPYVFRLDERGLHDRSGVFQAARLPWEDLAGAKVVFAEGREQIGLVLTDAGRGRATIFVRRLMDEHRSAFGVDVIVAPEAMGKAPAGEHVSLLRRYIDSSEKREELRPQPS